MRSVFLSVPMAGGPVSNIRDNLTNASKKSQNIYHVF